LVLKSGDGKNYGRTSTIESPAARVKVQSLRVRWLVEKFIRFLRHAPRQHCAVAAAKAIRISHGALKTEACTRANSHHTARNRCWPEMVWPHRWRWARPCTVRQAASRRTGTIVRPSGSETAACIPGWHSGKSQLLLLENGGEAVQVLFALLGVVPAMGQMYCPHKRQG